MFKQMKDVISTRDRQTDDVTMERQKCMYMYKGPNEPTM